MRHAFVTGAAILVGLVLVGSAAATSPHAKARTLLLTCRNAIASVPVGPVTANTPEVPQMNRRAHAVYAKCQATGAMLNLAAKHQRDATLEDAYRAYMELALGIGDYQQYLINVAFGHTGEGILHNAEREIAQGRALAKQALAKLA